LRYRVTHSTEYEYPEPVVLSYNVVRMQPRHHAAQSCLQFELDIEPEPASATERLDYFGNHTHCFCLQESHRRLAVLAKSEVRVPPRGPVYFVQQGAWERVRDTLHAPRDRDTIAAREFTFDSAYVFRSDELAVYALPSFAKGRPFLECVLDLTERIHREFEFLPGSTGVGTPSHEVLRSRRGVCQDFAHLQIGCLRSLGLAARYVSGYLVTTPPPSQRRLKGADVSHAWVSVFVPGLGWVDFDPTNGLMPSDGHITVAWARDYDEVGPSRGIVVGGKDQRLHVSVDVMPLVEDSAAADGDADPSAAPMS